MKILCLILDLHDRQWVSDFLNKRSAEDNIIFLAPTFDGKIAAESLGIKYKSYEDIAWDLDKPGLHDIARKKARYWHEISELKADPNFNSIKEFQDYPLLLMHQSLILLAVLEVIQAHQYIHKVLEIEKPDSVIYGKRKNPFLSAPIEFISDSKGVEREILKALYYNRLSVSDKFDDFLKEVTIVPPVDKSDSFFLRQFQWPKDLDGPKILIFAWSDYYLEYFEGVLDNLLKQKARICIVVIGGNLSHDQQSKWKLKGIHSFRKSDWVSGNETELWDSWKNKTLVAVRSIYESKALEEYFSDEYGSYYQGLVSDFICKQILDFPNTVIELQKSESIIKYFSPDVVVNHFAYHPNETCDILPARSLGIPTISFDHGINGLWDSQRLTFATNYYAVSGSSFRDGVVEALNISESYLPVIGNCRYDRIEIKSSSSYHAKLKYGFDPERPLCIFCDSSGWSHMNEWRNSTSSTVEAIVSLKKIFPELQIIYRVHHGSHYLGMQAYFASLKDPDIRFQISPDPQFLDIVNAADFVISHFSSAITESLLSGVPVIYLAAKALTEPSCLGCEVIKVADSFDKIPLQIIELSESQLTRVEIRKKAQPYFDIALAGNDGKASNKLSDLILKFSSIPQWERKPGFEDWINRIDASCSFQLNVFNKYLSAADGSKRKSEKKENSMVISKISNKAAYVSIIIPAYNRAKMIGTTLESFISQNYPQDCYEIIVADNNSTDETKAVVLEWQKKSPVPVKYILEQRQGVHYARNTAAKSATGEILYFTDDDMVAEHNLLTELIKVFDLSPKLGTATGRVLPLWEVQPPEWILKLCYNGWLSIFDSLGDVIKIEDEDPGVYSCHQAIRSDVFFQAGGFNPESTYSDYIGDGETGLNIKIRDLGFKFGYNGKSVIHHMIPPSRMTQDYLNKRLANQGSADCYTEYKKNVYDNNQLSERIKQYMIKLYQCSAESVRLHRLGDLSWRIQKAYTHYYLNRIEYDLRLIDDANWRELVLKDNWINE